jgi:hypothetical protein
MKKRTFVPLYEVFTNLAELLSQPVTQSEDVEE